MQQWRNHNLITLLHIIDQERQVVLHLLVHDVK